MKRIILSIFLVFTAALSLSAQGKHEASFCIGGPVGGIHFQSDDSGFYYDPRSGNTLKELYDDQESTSSIIGLSLDYTYKVKEWLKLGAEAGLGLDEIYVRKGLAYADSGNLNGAGRTHITLMPMARIRYKDGYMADVYARVAAGVEYCTDWGDFRQTAFAWQVVPLGLSFGKKNFHILWEIGVGTCYVTKFGVSLEF